jgi:hypothetical protein
LSAITGNYSYIQEGTPETSADMEDDMILKIIILSGALLAGGPGLWLFLAAWALILWIIDRASEVLNQSLQAIALIVNTLQLVIDNEIGGEQWLVN